MDFFPTKKQTEEYLKSVFIEKGLAEVVKLHKAQASHEAKRELTQVQFIVISLILCFYLFYKLASDVHFRKEFYLVFVLPKKFFGINFFMC